MDAAGAAIAHHQPFPEGAWTQGPVSLARGRSAKDPNAQTATYTVHSLEEFEVELRKYLANPPADPEHAEGHFNFWIGASFLVAPPGLSPQERVALEAHQRRESQQHQTQSQPSQQQAQPSQQLNTASQPSYNATGLDAHYAAAAAAQAHQQLQNLQNVQNGSPAQVQPQATDQPSKVPMSIMEALAPTVDPKERMRKQRAIAKTCVDTIQRVDGYRYSFHNNWNSREDDAFRFSYYCNDSLLNKDRAANGKGQKVAGKRATKPVYDCKGVLAVKFSAVKNSLDIHYRHIPKHKTYEERAPPPRRDSKRRKWMEDQSPGAISQRKPRREQEAVDPDAPTPLKKKRARKSDKEQPASSIESSLRAESLQSLLSLIRTDDPQPVHGTASVEVVTENVANPSGVTGQPPQPTQPAQPNLPIQPGNLNGIDAAPPTKRRQKSSCENCRMKRTRCDAVRPRCKSCSDKGITCIYNDPNERAPGRSFSGAPQLAQAPEAAFRGIDTPATVQSINQPGNMVTPVNASVPPTGMSDLEKMRAELEAARQRIAQLEAEKTGSPTVMQNSMAPNVSSMGTVSNTPRNRESIHQQFQQRLQTPTHIPQTSHDNYGRSQIQQQVQQTQVQQQQVQQTQVQQQQIHHQHQQQQQPQQNQQTQHHPQHSQHMRTPQQPQWTPWTEPYGYPNANLQGARTDQWGNPRNNNNLFRG